MNKPQLFNYLNLSHYLIDLYNYRKVADAGFSYESWAHELEMNNRNLLRLIVLGRRNMTDHLVIHFVKRMNLNADETKYFRNLVSYSQSKTIEQKKFYAQQLATLCPLLESSLQQITSYEEFVSDPFLPKLQVLLSFNDIEQSTESLAKISGETKEHIELSLKKLEKLELISKKNNRWKVSEKSFKVSDQFGSQALQQYHAQILKQAIKSQTLPKQLRRFRSLLVALNEDELNLIFEEMNTVAQKIFNNNRHEGILNRRLFQFNMNVYPVSEKNCNPGQNGLKSSSDLEASGI